MNNKKSYEDQQKWREIQKFLPINNQINQECQPAEEWVDAFGFQVHVDHYKQYNPKGCVVIFHGVGGNGRLLEFIAVPLWKRGYEVICPDMPLYGLTVHPRNVTYEDWIKCGVVICNHYMRDSIPFFTFGLSAGGMLAYQISSKLSRIDGLMMTCLLDQRIARVTNETASSRIVAVLGKPFLKVFHRPFGRIKLPMKLVCKMKLIVNNENLAKLLMSDPLPIESHGLLELEMFCDSFMKNIG